MRKPHNKAPFGQWRPSHLRAKAIVASPHVHSTVAKESAACAESGGMGAGVVQAISQDNLELSPHTSSSPITPSLKKEAGFLNMNSDSAVTAPSAYSSQPVEMGAGFEHAPAAVHTVLSAPAQHRTSPDAQRSSSCSHPFVSPIQAAFPSQNTSEVTASGHPSVTPAGLHASDDKTGMLPGPSTCVASLAIREVPVVPCIIPPSPEPSDDDVKPCFGDHEESAVQPPEPIVSHGDHDEVKPRLVPSVYHQTTAAATKGDPLVSDPGCEWPAPRVEVSAAVQPCEPCSAIAVAEQPVGCAGLVEYARYTCDPPFLLVQIHELIL